VRCHKTRLTNCCLAMTPAWWLHIAWLNMKLSHGRFESFRGRRRETRSGAGFRFLGDPWLRYLGDTLRTRSGAPPRRVVRCVDPRGTASGDEGRLVAPAWHRRRHGRSAREPEEMDLAELLAMPGVREECILRSNVGFLALHGGSQDRGTEQIARRAADRAGASYYAIVHPSGLRVHLTSRLHDPGHSAHLRTFLEHVDVAISVHGFGRDGFALWCDPDRGLVIEPYGPAMRGKQTGPLRGIIVGGLNAPLLDAAREVFNRRFADYRVADERVRLGFHPANPVNLPSAHGVQVELPPGLRGIGDFGETLVPRQDGVVSETVAALVELAARATEMARPTPEPRAEQASGPRVRLAPDGSAPPAR